MESGLKEIKIETLMTVKTQKLSDLWDEKVLEKGRQAVENVKIKADTRLEIDQSLNQTIPWVNFLKKTSKPGSIFEMEVVSVKGYYYRVAFSNSEYKEIQNTPDTQDVYCEIRIIIPQIKAQSE